MKQLLWKEYHQNRPLLQAVGIVLLLPYIYFPLCLGLLSRLIGGPPVNWLGLCWKASFLSLLLWSIAVAFIGGGIFAGERSDRSAEFLDYLPISAHRAVAGKAFLAVGACLFFWLINMSIYLMTSAGQSFSPIILNDIAAAIGLTWMATAVLNFGASWLFSSLFTRTALAVACGLAVVALLGGVVSGLSGLRMVENTEALKVLYNSLCLILGTACFVAGIFNSLRRSPSALS